MRKNIILHISAFALSYAAPKLHQQVPQELVTIETVTDSLRECEEVLEDGRLVNIWLSVRTIKDLNNQIKSFFERHDEMLERIRNFQNAEEAYNTACDSIKNAQEEFYKYTGRLSIEANIQEVIAHKERVRVNVANDKDFVEHRFWQIKGRVDPKFFWKAWDLKIQAFTNLKFLFSMLDSMKTSLEKAWTEADAPGK